MKDDEENADELFDGVPFHAFNDYQVLLRAVQALEAQKRQAKIDLAMLQDMHRDALADPAAFVLRLLSDPPVRVPERQRIVAVPSLAGPKSGAKVSGVKHDGSAQSGSNIWEPVNSTYAALVRSSDGWQKYIFGHSSQPPETEVKAVPITMVTPAPPTAHVVREASVPATDEGEMLAPRRPLSFNQLWSPEEHVCGIVVEALDECGVSADSSCQGKRARLVELLEVYPEEEVQAQRWEKISKALGSRTPRQVASRTQKYFLKLQQSGLPIPGARPDLAQAAQAKGEKPSKKKQRLEGDEGAAPPTVYMSDDDKDSESDQEVDDETKNTEEYKELKRLRKLRRKKEREQVVSQGTAHFGYKCDGCGMEPIHGVRWTCGDNACADVGVDLCANCKASDWSGGNHLAEHEMTQHAKAESEAPTFYIDTDYASFGNQPNYLDPNYQPVHAAAQPP